MTGTRRPLSLRLARVFFLIGTVVLVVLLLYVAAAVVYASQVTNSGTSGTSVTTGPGDTLEIRSGFNVSDPGPFAISHLTIVSHLAHPDGTPWLAGRSGAVDIPGGSVRTLTISLPIALEDLGASRSLLVNDSSLPWMVWVNATYAGLVGIALSSNSTYAWGAPFHGFNASFSAPARLPNGTWVENATFSFSNHSPLDLAGNLTLTAHAAGGAACGSVRVPVDAPSQATYQSSPTVYLPSGNSCSPAGGTYSATWTGMGLSFDLPTGSPT
ncbi:MAG TPA: hypothetical protein VGV89_05545 [Thermoplasmata archaeon]|nr:hypothetical protein [Thermoplasmata archaeon]